MTFMRFSAITATLAFVLAAGLALTTAAHAPDQATLAHKGQPAPASETTQGEITQGEITQGETTQRMTVATTPVDPATAGAGKITALPGIDLVAAGPKR
jgi:hypothetical protein